MNTKIKTEVKRAYNEATRQLNFRASKPVSVNDAVIIMTDALEIKNETVKGYNNFSPSLLRNLPDNTKVTLAREGSVCVYVHLPKGAKLGEHFAHSHMLVDEYHLQESGTIRLWWD